MGLVFILGRDWKKEGYVSKISVLKFSFLNDRHRHNIGAVQVVFSSLLMNV